MNRIAAHADPVVHNLLITHCYHELSRAPADRTGGPANRCTLAMWASEQVGQTIRQEDPARVLERMLKSSPDTAAAVDLLVRALRRAVPRQALDNAERLVRQAVVATARLDASSDASARGNLKVFEEIAREFARFPASSADGTDASCAALRPGEPPEGQRFLRQAFTRYHQAMSTDDPKERAELLLLANIEICLHEQTRLQPEISAALEAPLLGRRTRSASPPNTWPTTPASWPVERSPST